MSTLNARAMAEPSVKKETPSPDVPRLSELMSLGTFFSSSSLACPSTPGTPAIPSSISPINRSKMLIGPASTPGSFSPSTPVSLPALSPHQSVFPVHRRRRASSCESEGSSEMMQTQLSSLLADNDSLGEDCSFDQAYSPIFSSGHKENGATSNIPDADIAASPSQRRTPRKPSFPCRTADECMDGLDGFSIFGIMRQLASNASADCATNAAGAEFKSRSRCSTSLESGQIRRSRRATMNEKPQRDRKKPSFFEPESAIRNYTTIVRKPLRPVDKSSGATNFLANGKRKVCSSCGAKSTPYWRDGWEGACLCNACGIRYKKRRVSCNHCSYVPRKDERSTHCQKCNVGVFV